MASSATSAGRRRVLGGAAASLVGAAFTGLGSGCAVNTDADHSGPDAPASGALAQPPRTAWVFSSGGPRGFVHVGVLKGLEELQCKPDLIVGASVGALVAVLCGSGLSAVQIETLALDLQPWQLARVAAVSGTEKLSGSALADYVREQVRERLPEPLLERLRVPVVCVAQRMSDGTVIGFNRGDVGLAVQAASAITGQFVPVRINGQRHTDADQSMPLPVRLARALGAVRVLAVDASAHEDKAPAGTDRYRAGDLRKRALTQPDAALADVLLHPEFGYYVSLSREFRQRAIESGYRATLAAGAAIRALHTA
jgi:NTE family protein